MSTIGGRASQVWEHSHSVLDFRNFLYATEKTEGKSTKKRDASFSSEVAARSALQRASRKSAILESPEISGGPTC